MQLGTDNFRTLSAFIPGLNSKVERLMFVYSTCRRRAYSMMRNGTSRLTIISELSRESGIPSRYVEGAYGSISKLPSHVTFGGLSLQRLREGGKISREEYKMRRNNILACRGQLHSERISVYEFLVMIKSGSRLVTKDGLSFLCLYQRSTTNQSKMHRITTF